MRQAAHWDQRCRDGRGASDPGRDARLWGEGLVAGGVVDPSEELSSLPLSAAAVGACFQVESLPSDPLLRSRLQAMGVKPGAQLLVLRRGQPGGILHVACGMVEFMIRQEYAAQLMVRCWPP
jgi:ferrous iron transport protein A